MIESGIVPRSTTMTVRWTFGSADAASAERARRGLVASLEREGATPEYTATAQMILSELLANVVRHAPGDVEILFDRYVDRPVLHVLDRGSGFTFFPRLPSDPLAESGRGLFLVDALADELHVVDRLGGGSHAIVVLNPMRTD